MSKSDTNSNEILDNDFVDVRIKDKGGDEAIAANRTRKAEELIC